MRSARPDGPHRGGVRRIDPPGPDEITQALWSACHGGQLEAAAHLIERGADVNWIGWDELTPLEVAEQSGTHDLIELLRRHGAVRAAEAR